MKPTDYPKLYLDDGYDNRSSGYVRIAGSKAGISAVARSLGKNWRANGERLVECWNGCRDAGIGAPDKLVDVVIGLISISSTDRGEIGKWARETLIKLQVPGLSFSPDDDSAPTTGSTGPFV